MSITTRPISNSSASAEPEESGGWVIGSVYENRGRGATVKRCPLIGDLARIGSNERDRQPGGLTNLEAEDYCCLPSMQAFTKARVASICAFWPLVSKPRCFASCIHSSRVFFAAIAGVTDGATSANADKTNIAIPLL